MDQANSVVLGEIRKANSKCEWFLQLYARNDRIKEAGH